MIILDGATFVIHDEVEVTVASLCRLIKYFGLQVKVTGWSVVVEVLGSIPTSATVSCP